MKKKRRYLTATMPDGYVKTIGPTTDSFTHYWRIVAELDNGKTEVFWGHARSLAEARRKQAPAEEAKRMRGWRSLSWKLPNWSKRLPDRAPRNGAFSCACRLSAWPVPG